MMNGWDEFGMHFELNLLCASARKYMHCLYCQMFVQWFLDALDARIHMKLGALQLVCCNKSFFLSLSFSLSRALSFSRK